MAEAQRLSGFVMKRMALLLRHDYQARFVPRFNHAASLRPKQRPGKAADQMRNAVDHFAKALSYAMDSDSKLASQKDRRKREASLAKATMAIELNLARAKKHFVSGQFYCLRYAVGIVHQDIDRLLKSPQARGRSEFEKSRKQIREWRASWAPMLEPQSDETDDIEETLREIRRLRQDNRDMDDTLDDLENLYGRLEKKIRKIVPL
jgi:hypothetical protein